MTGVRQHHQQSKRCEGEVRSRHPPAAEMMHKDNHKLDCKDKVRLLQHEVNEIQQYDDQEVCQVSYNALVVFHHHRLQGIFHALLV